MIESVYNALHASAYDELYREKDYQAECNLLESFFQNYSNKPVRRILDLGCGTGTHAILLSERGYEVMGVDHSDNMLKLAQEKASKGKAGKKPLFYSGDLCTVDLKQTFDAVIMMFAVLGYQVENTCLAAALRTVRTHLSPNGLFIFDVWHGPAVLMQRPSGRVRLQTREDSTIIRTASSYLETNKHTCSVKFKIWRIEGDRIIGQDEETHRVRFFFPKELEYMLRVAGLRLAALRAFPATDRYPDETTWNVIGVAEAVATSI
jgi:SAM-dependent methyltransferase